MLEPYMDNSNDFQFVDITETDSDFLLHGNCILKIVPINRHVSVHL